MCTRDTGHRVTERIVDKPPDELVRGAVDGEPSLVTAGDEAHPAQQGELMAHGRQWQLEGVREIAYRELVMGQRMKDADTDRICESLEDLDRFVDHVGGRDTVASRANSIGVEHGRELIRGNIHKC